jgi:hypothetical protein
MHRWIRDTLRRTTVEPFLAYIESEFASDVRQYEFWMPITQLHVKRGFRLGKGSILPIEKSLIDRIQQSAADRYPERANASRAFTDRFYRRYQGFAAFVVTRNVEISWGWELAFEDARVAAAMIRVFSGQAMAPEVRSGVAPWGCAQGDAIHGFALTEGFQAAGIEGGRGVDPSPLIWDDEGILQAHREGLAVVSAILAKDDRSDYEEKLLEMLLLYSGGLVRTDPADRLMYTLIALEQMFLRSESEPITQNLADRIALFAADTVDDRRKVMQLVRRAYATRSRFVHHGQTVAELNDLGDFLREAWMTVILLIGRSAWFNTREELLDAIDTAKLSGASLSARAPDGNAAA